MRTKTSIILAILFCSVICAGSVCAEEYTVGILIWKTARTYDENMEGLQVGLQDTGLVIQQEIHNANGNKEKAIEIFQKFIKEKKDLIVAFGSHGLTIGAEQVTEIPLVVLGCNTPIAYGITDTPEKPGGNITGSSYYIDPAQQIAYLKKILPHMKRLGIIYNPENGASLAELPATRKACLAAGLECVESTINRDMVEGKLECYDMFVNKIPAAVNALLGKVDAIVIPTNSEIYDNISHVLSVANPQGLPVLSYAKKGVEKGALAGITADNATLGKETAKTIKRILHDKEDPGDIGFIFDTKPHRIINLQSAKKIDYSIPVFAIKVANEVIS